MSTPPLVALEFLTTVRLRRVPLPSEADLTRAVLYFPAVGLLLGVAIAAVDRGLREVLPLGPASALVLVLLAVLTGGLHLDGLADASDGLFGGHDREDRLRIMHDKATGAYGAAALALILLVDWSALSSVAGPRRTAVLVLAPLFARSAMVAAMAIFPCARTSGLGRSFRAGARPALAVAVAISAIAPVLAFGPAGLALLAGAVAGALAFAAYAAARAGGLTGDLYGATTEIGQALTLLIAASSSRIEWLTPTGVFRP